MRCPLCGAPLQPAGGRCWFCPSCGWQSCAASHPLQLLPQGHTMTEKAPTWGKLIPGYLPTQKGRSHG